METENTLAETTKEKENNLKSIILELGDAALAIKYPQGIIKNDGEILDQIYDIIEYNRPNFEKLVKNIKNSIPELYDEMLTAKKKDYELNNGNSYKIDKKIENSVSVMGHDLLSLIVRHHNLRTYFDYSDEFPEYVTSENAKYALSTLEASKQFLQIMAYITSDGDKKYITAMPFENAGKIISNTVFNSENGNNLELTVSELSNKESMIETPEFVSLFEMAKNTAKYSGNKAEISKYDYDDLEIIKITDYGKGIRSKDGSPIKKEDLPKIFDEKVTTNGTGIGLHLVKILSDMRNNDVSVITNFPDSKKSLFYSLHNHLIMNTSFNGEQGTEFNIYYRMKNKK